MKEVNCTKCNEEYAIDLNKPEEWYCPYCDNLYSYTTDKLSFEKLQEQLNTAKKALTEISKFLPTEDARIAIDALAAIGDEGSGDE
jgi:hypothetical protein